VLFVAAHPRSVRLDGVGQNTSLRRARPPHRPGGVPVGDVGSIRDLGAVGDLADAVVQHVSPVIHG
jgi:hypothetical protein